MKRNIIKKAILASIAILVLPLCVKAEDLFILSCEKQNGESCTISGSKYQVEAGQKVKIIMSVESDKIINGLSSKIVLTNMSDLSNFTFASIWNNQTSTFDQTALKFIAGREPREIPENENATKPIGTLEVTAGTALGEAKIEFTDIKLSYLSENDGLPSYDLVDLTNNSLTFDVVESTDDNNTIDNSSNTNTGDTESSKSDSKKGNAVSNPKTGVKVSVASLIILAVGAGAYVVLRKKNYFNKI